jgi:NitT/TauT family transport system permease protein
MAITTNVATPTGRPGRGIAAFLAAKLTPFVGILVFLAVWQAAVAIFKAPAYLVPAPTEIFRAFFSELPKLLHHGWITTYEMLLGYGLAVIIAIPLAIAITSSSRFDRFVMPTMLFFQVVPKVAIAPLFLVWFGVGTTPKVLLAFLISFFPIVIDAAVGLRSMSSEMNDLARSMGATRMQVFAQFRLPTSLPYLFSGLKVAATLAVAGAVVGEFVGADKGLGYLLMVTGTNLETAMMFATLVALTIIGLVFFYVVEFLETLLIPWHVSHRVREDPATI